MITLQPSERQARILKFVVEAHHATGRPVGSHAIVESGAVRASSSTVRYELGRLEQIGLIESPHTSAGRVPTDRGYRFYVDNLLDQSTAMGRTDSELFEDDFGPHVDEVLRAVTQSLAEATGLLALITAPRATGSSIKHVEVLQLQLTWQRSPSESVAEAIQRPARFDSAPQSEAIAYARSGAALLSVAEGVGETIFRSAAPGR